VFNLQRALLFVQGVQRRDYGCLREALRDRWHQPYRAAIVPGLSEVLALDHPAMIGACLSGSGPAVLVFATGALPEIERLLVAVYERLGVPCTVRALSAHQPGASA
jgi:homoserine kinase